MADIYDAHLSEKGAHSVPDDTIRAADLTLGIRIELDSGDVGEVFGLRRDGDRIRASLLIGTTGVVSKVWESDRLLTVAGRAS